MLRQFRLTVCAVMASGGLTGCGMIASGAATSSPPVAQWVPTQWSAVTQHEQYPGSGIRLDPPTSGVTPTYSVGQAYSTCTSGVAPCLSGTPVASLAMFSDDQYGKIQPDGSVSHPFQGVLAWVLTWHNEFLLYPRPGTPVGDGCPFVSHAGLRLHRLRQRRYRSVLRGFWGRARGTGESLAGVLSRACFEDAASDRDAVTI